MANGYNINAILSVTNRFTQPLNQFRQQMSNIRNPIRQAQNSTQQFGQQAREAFNNASNSATQMGTNISNVSSKIKGALATLGIAKIGTDVVSTYASFEKSMSKVQALSGATGDDFKQLEDKAKEMGAKTSKSASESADALGYMALAGWDTQQMLDGLEPILRASEAGQMDLARCSDLVTDSMSAMGIKTQDLSHYLDVCTKAQASSNTSLDQLMEAYIGCGGTLKNMNVPVEESATLLGTLANRGKKGSEAGNALNSILVNLMGTTSTTSGALAKLGVSAYNEDGSFRGVTATLKDLNTALGGCTQEQRDMLEAQLGGKTQMDTLQALLSGVSEEYGDLNGKLNDCDGYLNNCAETMQNNLSGQWTTFKSQVESVKIAVGEKLEPVLKNVMQTINDKMPEIKDKLSNFTEWLVAKLPEIKDKLIQLKPVIMGVASAFLAFKSINTVIKTISQFKNVLKGLSILTSPIGLIAIAIGLVVAGFIYAYTHSETFREKVNAVVEVVKEKVIAFKDKVVDCIVAIKKFLKKHQEQVNAVKEFIKGIINLIIEMVGDFITNIGTIIGGIIDVISGVIDIITGIFTGDWDKVWEGMKEVVSGAIEIVKGWWNELIDLFKKPIKFVVNLFKKDQSETDSVSSEDTETTEEVGQNAKGTNNWRGGLTWVNEEGGELMNLPSGTQIIPHDLSETMVKEHARNIGNGMTVTIPKLADQITIREDADIDKIGNAIANKLNIARLRFN